SGGAHWNFRRGRGGTRKRVRYRAAGRDPLELRSAAQRTRRLGYPGHLAAPRAYRIVERTWWWIATLDFARVSIKSRSAGARGFAGAACAHHQYVSARVGAGE